MVLDIEYTDVQSIDDQDLDDDLIVHYGITIFGPLRQFRTSMLCISIQKCIALSAIGFLWVPCIYPYIPYSLKTFILLVPNSLEIYVCLKILDHTHTLLVYYSIIFFALSRQFILSMLCTLAQRYIIFPLYVNRFHWVQCIDPHILYALKRLCIVVV